MERKNGPAKKKSAPKSTRKKNTSKSSGTTTTNGFDDAVKTIIKMGPAQFTFDNYLITVEKIVDQSILLDDDYAYWSA